MLNVHCLSVSFSQIFKFLGISSSLFLLLFFLFLLHHLLCVVVPTLNLVGGLIVPMIVEPVFLSLYFFIQAVDALIFKCDVEFWYSVYLRAIKVGRVAIVSMNSPNSFCSSVTCGDFLLCALHNKASCTKLLLLSGSISQNEAAKFGLHVLFYVLFLYTCKIT